MNKLLKKVDINLLKYVAIFTVIFMFIAHGFCYLNLLFSHDSLNIYHNGYYDDSLEIGRFLIPVWTFIRGEYYPPFLIGTLSVIFMVLINYFICKMFSFKDKKAIFVTSLLLCTCSTITLINATYINYSDMYLFTFLLNILAVYFFRKKNKLSLFLSFLMLIMSFAIYPSYLGVTLGLYIGLLLIDLINNREWKDAFKEGLKFIALVIVSLIVYAVCNKLILGLINIDMTNNYNSINNTMNFSSISSMFICMIKTYLLYFKFFLYPHTFHSIFVLCLNVLVALIAIYNGIKLVKEKSIKKANVIFIVLLCLVVPFALNIIYFISSGFIHDLMLFAINITYIYIIWLLPKNPKSLLAKITYISLVVIACLNIVYSNQIYEKKKMEFDSTISTMNRVINRVEEVEGYEIGKTPVVIIGNINKGPLAMKKEKLDYKAIGQGSTFATTYNRSYYRFINYYMGYPMNIVDEDKAESPVAKELSNKEEIKQMHCYPDKDSIQMIDGKLIIKFSQPNS